ncbi:MAG: hypothetical protein CXT71_07555 [Methanobacteriota archaeon]|jgi:dimethylargininase|nr:MAG: hypothetical protein CXT71_07555 [Euryarchaeota archaeon]HIL65771.1 hypothetical protein [Candidatus Poseidoniales archaeon]
MPRRFLIFIAENNFRIPNSYEWEGGRRFMPGTFDRSRRSAVTRRVSKNFDHALSKYFGVNTPDAKAGQGAHDAYVAALRAHGTEVTVLPGLDNHPDCCFVEDVAVMVCDKAIIPKLGHESREGEQMAIIEYLRGGSEIIHMNSNCTLDGGDVIFLDDRYLIGISTRTNRAGAEFLAKYVKEAGFEVELIEIPDSTLHLTTVCSSPRPGTLVAAEGHLSINQIGHLAEEIIWVPNSETYAANTIGYPEDKVIIAAGYSATRQLLLDAGFNVTTVDMDAIREADGSLTCLSQFNA